jgi:hypothetical protein
MKTFEEQAALKMYHALHVVRDTPAIRGFLAANDPQALAQVERAIDAALSGMAFIRDRGFPDNVARIEDHDARAQAAYDLGKHPVR